LKEQSSPPFFYRMSRPSFNADFLRELERLNPAQREAVERIEGPVMVVAGPGTGKTHILAARIGKILLETDTQAQNILCLTFTDAGVNAMRERLLQLIGPDAHRVHIFTFHSFCNKIIQDNLELFGRQDLEPLSELEKVDLIRSLLDPLDVEHPLKSNANDPYFYEGHLQDLFNRMQMEDWTAEHVAKAIDAFLSELPERPEYRYQRRQGQFEKGDLRLPLIQKAEERMRKLRAAAELFPQYAAAKLSAQRYDYHDMIGWVLRAFAEDEWLLRTYQEQYLYILVDEYQDTNGAQNEILLQLISYWDSPNVFIVGDDDQSIFEFQGARLKNLSDFYEKYRSEIGAVVLRENYRSPQGFLDAASALLQNNTLRVVERLRELGLDKKLHAQSTGPIPQVLEYANRLAEEADLLRQIKAWKAEGLEWSDMAIIYAQHRQARNLMVLLEKEGIPYQSKRKVNILEVPLIRRVLDLLLYLLAESRAPHQGEQRLFQILHAPYLGLPAADLARLSVYQTRFKAEDRPNWRHMVNDLPLLQNLDLEQPEKLHAFGRLLEELIPDSVNLPPPALLEKTLNRSGLLQAALAEPTPAVPTQQLYTFFQFVQDECLRRPQLSLGELLHNLQRMEDNRLPLELAPLNAQFNGVNLLTAHGAKGLEFEAVILLDCVKDYWEPGGGRNSFRFTFPDTLTFSGEEDATEARRRLFYVALTRAKSRLLVTYARQDHAGKALQRALFVDELLALADLNLQAPPVSEEALLQAQGLQLQLQQTPYIPELDRALAQALLQDFRLSISALNTFLNCPLSFYYEYVLRVPGLHNDATAYGTAVHNALQRLFGRMLLSNERLFPGEKEFLHIFEQELHKQRGSLSPAAFAQRLELGKRQLRRYYQYYLGRWHRRVRVEYVIRQVEVEGVPLTGAIDKIEFYDQLRVGIVDYKTGSHDGTKLRRPNENNPHGGSYWRQLLFYKVMYEAFDRSARSVKHGEIAYLEPTPDGQFPEVQISFSPTDTAWMRSLIRETHQKIQAHEFYTGCGKSTCAWCSFVKREIKMDRIERAATAEMDEGLR
jgi:DNA helicase II / ATP-dependent DNA helicase PcrA